MTQTTKDFATKASAGTIRIRLDPDRYNSNGGVNYQGRELMATDEKGKALEHEVDERFGMQLFQEGRAARWDEPTKRWIESSAAERAHGDFEGHAV